MNKTAKQYQQCLAGEVHNCGEKTILVPRHLRPFPGPLEHLKLDFIQLLLSMGYQYVLVIVNICMFSP